MAVPALRFPISADMAEFDRGMQKARQVSSETTKQVVKNFVDMNGEFRAVAREIASQAAWSAARMAAPYLAAGASIVAGFAVISAVVGQAREALQQMVDIADKARDLNVSPEFLQRFRSESRGLQVDIEDLDRALGRAFEATKEKSPIDIGEWETAGERITDVEKALRVYNVAVKEAAGRPLQGLIDFRNATDQEQKVVAVLNAMKQLQALGMNLQALDLGERMFGAGFVDKLRTGQTTVESMLQRVTEISAAGQTMFSDEMVRRAKEVDDQLRIAQQRLADEMKPNWESVERIILNLKGTFADIVDLLARMLAVVNQIDFGSWLVKVLPVYNAIAAIYRLVYSGQEQPTEGAPTRITVTPQNRGEGAAPTKKSTSSTSTADPFATRADAIERRTAMLEAEARTIDLGTQAREKAKVVAELETVAIQANTAAGRENTAVTDEQRARIEAVAEAYAKAQLAIEQARSPLAMFARESANLNLALNRFAADTLDGMTDQLASVVTGTQSVGDAFRNMTASILQDLARLAIRQSITGPLAGALAGAFGGGAAGGGLFASLFGGGRASGGGVDAGRVYQVGERGRELFVPHVNGTIVPNFQVGSASAPNVSLSNQIVIEDHNNNRVSMAEESDGRGGRRSRLVLDDMVAGAVGQPGSSANRAMLAALGVRRTPRRTGA